MVKRIMSKKFIAHQHPFHHLKQHHKTPYYKTTTKHHTTKPPQNTIIKPSNLQTTKLHTPSKPSKPHQHPPRVPEMMSIMGRRLSRSPTPAPCSPYRPTACTSSTNVRAPYFFEMAHKLSNGHIAPVVDCGWFWVGELVVMGGVGLVNWW